MRGCVLIFLALSVYSAPIESSTEKCISQAFSVVGYAKDIVADIAEAIHGDGKAIETLIADFDSIIGAVERLPIDCEDMIPKKYVLQWNGHMCMSSLGDLVKNIVMLPIDYLSLMFDKDRLADFIRDFGEIFESFFVALHYCSPFKYQTFL